MMDATWNGSWSVDNSYDCYGARITVTTTTATPGGTATIPSGIGGGAGSDWYLASGGIKKSDGKELISKSHRIGFGVDITVSIGDKLYSAKHPLMTSDPEENKKIIAECFEDIAKQVFNDLP